MASTNKSFFQTFSVASSEYKWTLHNFSSCNTLFVTSQQFANYLCVYGEDSEVISSWKLRLYPDGYREKGYISVYLESSNTFNIELEWEFYLSSNSRIYETKKYHTLFTQIKNEGRWGCPKYLERDTLLNDLKEGNNVVTIVLKIFYSKKPRNPHLHLINQLKILFSKVEENSDVTLVSKDGKQHKAHKTILICRSPIFSAMFQHNMKESIENIVKIDDVDDETLGAMLYFIYSAEVKGIQNIAKKLLLVADKYRLDDLVEICIDHLCENITIDNVLDLIEFSDTYSICTELQKKAKDYFLKNHKQVVLTKGLKNIEELAKNTVNHLLYDLALYKKPDLDLALSTKPLYLINSYFSKQDW